MFKTCKMVFKSINSLVGLYGKRSSKNSRRFFHVEQFLLAATPFFAYRNLLYRPYPNMGFKKTRIIELVATKAIFKLLSHYLLSRYSISASKGIKNPFMRTSQ